MVQVTYAFITTVFIWIDTTGPCFPSKLHIIHNFYTYRNLCRFATLQNCTLPILSRMRNQHALKLTALMHVTSIFRCNRRKCTKYENCTKLHRLRSVWDYYGNNAYFFWHFFLLYSPNWRKISVLSYYPPTPNTFIVWFVREINARVFTSVLSDDQTHITIAVDWDVTYKPICIFWHWNYHDSYHKCPDGTHLTLFILGNGKQVLSQKVVAQMKCRKMLRICTVCKDKTDFSWPILTGFNILIIVSICVG